MKTRRDDRKSEKEMERKRRQMVEGHERRDGATEPKVSKMLSTVRQKTKLPVCKDKRRRSSALDGPIRRGSLVLMCQHSNFLLSPEHLPALVVIQVSCV